MIFKPSILCGSILLSVFYNVVTISTNASETSFFEPLALDSTELTQEYDSFRLNGIFQFQSIYGYQKPINTGIDFSRKDRGWMSIPVRVDLSLEGPINPAFKFKSSVRFTKDLIYEFTDQFSYTQAEIDDKDKRFDIGESYLEWTANDNLWLRAGYQIIVWGESESISVIDIVNPYDLSMPFITPIEDLRLAVPTISAQYSVQNWLMELVLINNAGHNRFATGIDEFSPYAWWAQQGGRLYYVPVEHSTEVALRVGRYGNGYDYFFVAGVVNDNQSNIDSFDLVNKVIMLSQQRLTIYGLSGSMAFGHWLVSAEIARHGNTAHQGVEMNMPKVIGNKILAIVKLVYSGWQTTELDVEVSQYWVNQLAEQISEPREATNVKFGARKSLLNDKFEIDIDYYLNVHNKDAIWRLWLHYRYNDEMTFSAGIVGIQSADSDSWMYTNRYNDSLLFKFQYYF